VPDGRLLAIYLNDHLAGARIGVDLTRRCLRANRGSELGRFLEGLLADVEEDRRTLERVMGELGVRKSRGKRAAAVVAERLGRLKPNGQLTGYSPLSRVLELEGLTIGIEGKVSLWRNLRAAGVGERLPGVDLDRLLERAKEQRAAVEPYRLDAAKRAFATGAPPSAKASSSTASGTSL
jgi:hypothetical protein